MKDYSENLRNYDIIVSDYRNYILGEIIVEKFKIKLQQYCAWLNTVQGLIVCTVLFLPLGLFLIYRNNTFAKNIKVVCLTIGIIYIAIFTGIEAGLMYQYRKNDSQYNEIQELSDNLSNKNEQIKSLEQTSTEFTDYKTKMKPYEALSEADAKAKKVDADAADKVNTAINEMPIAASLNVNDKSKLSDTRKLYNGLTDSQKKLVNASKLTELEGKMTQLEADKVKQDAINAEMEKKKAEEKAKQDAATVENARLKAEQEAKGYETGITYDQLARNPDEYDGKKIKFNGKVLQVIEGSEYTEIRLAVAGNYDTILYCSIPKTSKPSSRILENDMITVSGLSNKLYTYTSTFGGEITIPEVFVTKVE